MDAATVMAWVDEYIQAWNSNDVEDIGRLFTVDAAYYTGPFDPSWRGREAIVQGWLGRQDTPGNTTFRYEVLANMADTAIIRGWTHYHHPPREFSNIWLIRFDLHGQCREFTEWWMERPVASITGPQNAAHIRHKMGFAADRPGPNGETGPNGPEAETAPPAAGGRRAINQGDIYWLLLAPPGAEEPDYPHPYVVVQDNVFNRSRINSVVVCALTSNLKRAKEPGNVLLQAGEANLPKQSVVVVSQVAAVDKTQLGEYIGSLAEPRIDQILAGMQFVQVLTERGLK